jgi:hypothetical protein
LRNLDPKTVRAAIEKALTGGNAAAQDAAVKLLADLDVYGKGCPTCARREAVDMAEVRRKLARLIERNIASEIEERAEQLAQERLAALKQEHALSCCPHRGGGTPPGVKLALALPGT